MMVTSVTFCWHDGWGRVAAWLLREKRKLCVRSANKLRAAASVRSIAVYASRRSTRGCVTTGYGIASPAEQLANTRRLISIRRQASGSGFQASAFRLQAFSVGRPLPLSFSI